MTVEEVVSVASKFGCPFCKLNTNDYRQFKGRLDEFISKYSGTDVWNEHVACWAVSAGRSTMEIWI